MFDKLDLVLGTVSEDVVNGLGERIEAPDIIAPEKARQRHMHSNRAIGTACLTLGR